MTMTKGLMTLPAPLYQQAKSQAVYNTSAPRHHLGNPLLEALPPILDDVNFYKLMSQMPIYEPADRELPPEQRKQLLTNLSLFFQPLPRHRELESDILYLLSSGYLTRNPIDPRQPATILQRPSQMDGSLVRPVSSLRSGLLTGLPGTGKTQALARILSFIPQVIHHTQYKGIPFEHDQVTWLKLECPGDASARALCLAFFQQMDWLLGTNYLENYEGSHAATSTMVPALGRVALLHSLGLLVIDEVQHLCRSQTPEGQPVSLRDREKLINFIVQVVNTLGVPVLLVGNSSFLEFLGNSAHLVRRGTGLQRPYWMRFQQDDEWRIFTDSLWKYQYLKNPSRLKNNEPLRTEFYNQTQGLADYAIKLFEGVQRYLIDEGGDEVITPQVLADVAKFKLSASIPLITALRDHDYDYLRQLKTVHPVDIFGVDSPEVLRGWPKKKIPGTKAANAARLAAQRQSLPEMRMPDLTKGGAKSDSAEGCKETTSSQNG